MLSPLRSSRWRVTVQLLFAAVACMPAGAVAQTAEARGLEIARAADARASGFGDLSVDVTMTLRDARGREHVRALRLSTLEMPEGGERSLIVFTAPRDQRGVALLTYSKLEPPDDQWLFLPALNRVKRIVTNNQSGPFVSSEFAFEDLASQEVPRYRWRYLRDETLGGLTCHVVERVPLAEYSGYSAQRVWFDADELRTWRIEYQDRRGRHLKTLQVSDYTLYEDRWWRPAHMHMVNHVTGRETDLDWHDYRFGTGLKESDFTVGALRRVR